MIFYYGTLSLFSSTILFMQRTCFGIFQRLGVESSSKNIGNTRKTSFLDCLKPQLVLLSGKKQYRKYKSLQTKTDLNRLYTQWGSHGSTHGSGISFPFTIDFSSLQIPVGDFGTLFLAPEKSTI